MRVLFITLDALRGVGGIQRFNARLIRALDELTAVGLVRDAVSASLWDPPQTPGPGRVRHQGFGRRKLAFAACVIRTASRLRPDVILWGHVLLLPLLPMVKLASPRSTHALVVHGVEVWGDPRYRMAPRWEPALVRRLDRVVSVSQTTAERMRRAYRLPADRFALLPNAVDLPDDNGEPRRGNHNTLRLLTVSRLSAKDSYKGVDVVLQALPRVAAERPVTYVVVGDGELRPRYEQLARHLGLGEVVRFVGRVDDRELERWYRWADAFALPSTGEGFGIVYLEAWANGLPVVAAAEAGAAEIVEDGKTGLLVEPGSSEAVAGALLRLARDPELRARLGAAGRATVQARYTHEHFRARLAGILLSLGG